MSFFERGKFGATPPDVVKKFLFCTMYNKFDVRAVAAKLDKIKGAK